MRVLVTGVTGQVGGAIVKALPSHISVVPADRQKLDLAQPDRIAALLDRIAPDLIINPAAYTAVDRAQDERDMAYRINAEAPGAVAHWAASRQIPMVHFSTDYVFDGTGTRAWREDDIPNPLSVYGASKLAGEDAVRTAGGPHLIIRTSWVYAPNGSNFLRTIMRLARERKELRVVDDQIGAPTSARLIAGTLSRMIGSNDARLASQLAAAQGGIVNVAASGETSWYGFAVAIVAGLKARGVALTVESIVPIATADYPTQAKRPINSRLDLTQLNKIFGIETARWEDSLAMEIDHLVLQAVD